MKGKIFEAITSDYFRSLVQEPETIKKLIKGGRSCQREPLIRNLIFFTLNSLYPNEFKKETNGRKDLMWMVTRWLCEVGHNLTIQPSTHSIEKIRRDYCKRVKQGGFSHYTVCQILTHFDQINPAHGIATRYLKDFGKITENEYLQKIEDIKQFSLCLDSEAKVIPMEPIVYDGTTLRLFFFIMNIH